MKKLEWLALLVLILLLLTNFLSLFGSALIARVYSREYVGTHYAHWNLITFARSLLLRIVNLAIGIWLFVQARQSNSTPWIWLLFGMAYGLIAAVLFYLLRIYEAKGYNNAAGPSPHSTA